MPKPILSTKQLMQEKGWVPLAEAARLIGKPHSTMVLLIDTQRKLDHCRVGRNRFVSASSVLKFVGEKAAEILELRKKLADLGVRLYENR